MLRHLLEKLSQHIPSEEGLSKFLDDVKSDIENKGYQLYCNMYRSTRICLICRYLVTGRKKA